MYWLPVVLLAITLVVLEIVTTKNWVRLVATVVVASLLTSLTVWIDCKAQTDDQEVWSGQITAVNHKDAWDEWIPPQTSCTTDSKGNQSCTTTAGYYEHHPAENYINTSDNGTIEVDHTPDGEVFSDDFPNSNAELAKYYPIGTPTSSVHTYTNKVQASYSIFKHKDIDPNKYPDLPDYPKNTYGYFHIDRIVGYVPNKQQALEKLDELNTYLNKTIPDPEIVGKTRSWKEVNLIFVNVGANKTIDYGYALQDKWKGGNKNDFVVSFSMDDSGIVAWVYPFSWSEVDILKLDVRDYMMNLKQIKDFIPVENEIANMVADKFVRKQFADFNYLQIDTSATANVIIWILNVGLLGANVYLSIDGMLEEKRRSSNRKIYR